MRVFSRAVFSLFAVLQPVVSGLVAGAKQELHSLTKRGQFRTRDCSDSESKLIADGLEEGARLLSRAAQRLDNLLVTLHDRPKKETYTLDDLAGNDDPTIKSTFNTWMAIMDWNFPKSIATPHPSFNPPERVQALGRMGIMQQRLFELAQDMKSSSNNAFRFEVACDTGDWLSPVDEEGNPPARADFGIYFDARDMIPNSPPDPTRTWVLLYAGKFGQPLALQKTRPVPPIAYAFSGMGGPGRWPNVLALNPKIISEWNQLDPNNISPSSTQNRWKIPYDTFKEVHLQQPYSKVLFNIYDMVHSHPSSGLIHALSRIPGSAGGHQFKEEMNCKVDPEHPDPHPHDFDLAMGESSGQASGRGTAPSESPFVFSWSCIRNLARENPGAAMVSAANLMFLTVALGLDFYDWSEGYNRPLASVRALAGPGF